MSGEIHPCYWCGWADVRLHEPCPGCGEQLEIIVTYPRTLFNDIRCRAEKDIVLAEDARFFEAIRKCTAETS